MGGGRLASKKVGMGGAVIAGLSHLRTDGVSEQHCSCCNFWSKLDLLQTEVFVYVLFLIHLMIWGFPGNQIYMIYTEIHIYLVLQRQQLKIAIFAVGLCLDLWLDAAVEQYFNSSRITAPISCQWSIYVAPCLACKQRRGGGELAQQTKNNIQADDSCDKNVWHRCCIISEQSQYIFDKHLNIQICHTQCRDP